MSTFSPSLRIELITTGDQAGVWGNTTNTNLGTLVESAITGYVSVSNTTADQALTAVNGAADQSRNQVIALTTTTGAAFNVYAPPAEKTYTIYNASAHAATLYNSTVLGNTTAAGAGAIIPTGKTVTLWSDGTNFVFQNDHLNSLTLGTALPVTSGGTGTTTSTGTGSVVLSTSPTLVTPALGTPSAVVLTNGTGLPLTTGTTGTLPTSKGGTNLTAFTANGVVYASSTSALATSSALTFSSGVRFAVNGVGLWRGAGTVLTNTVVGEYSMISNTTGAEITAVGQGALFFNQSGSNNSGFGSSTLVSNVSGSNNTAVGTGALFYTIGSNGTAVGAYAGFAALGGGNVMLGQSAGRYETGSDSFYVDNQDRTNTAGDKAGALLYGTFSATPASQTLVVNAKLTATYGVVTRVNSQTTTTAPWAWNSDNYDQQEFTALANALTINADAGSPANGQQAIFRFTDNGTARALTWTTGSSKSFRAIGVLLPTTTIANKTLYVGCVYNSTAARWDVIAVAQEA